MLRAFKGRFLLRSSEKQTRHKATISRAQCSRTDKHSLVARYASKSKFEEVQVRYVIVQKMYVA